MITTVFAIALTFSTWDECWAFYHDNPDLPVDQGFEVCGTADAWVETTAPTTSLRPKARPSRKEK